MGGLVVTAVEQGAQLLLVLVSTPSNRCQVAASFCHLAHAQVRSGGWSPQPTSAELGMPRGCVLLGLAGPASGEGATTHAGSQSRAGTVSTVPTWEANPRSDKLAAAAVRVPTTSLAAHPLRRVAAARRPARSVWRNAILWARLLSTNAEGR